jgi:hypothetical protein
MKIEKYHSFLNEALNFDDFKSKLSDENTEIKKDLLDLIKETLEETNPEINAIDVQDFISDYIAGGKESNMIDKLISDNDIFNFYLKHQAEIDELLNNLGYLDESPKDNDVYSLYDIVIDGTKESVLSSMKKIKKEIFK